MFHFEPWYPVPYDSDANDVAICECGAEDWQAIINPPESVRWECRDCGRVYDHTGKQVGHNG